MLLLVPKVWRYNVTQETAEFPVLCREQMQRGVIAHLKKRELSRLENLSWAKPQTVQEAIVWLSGLHLWGWWAWWAWWAWPGGWKRSSSLTSIPDGMGRWKVWATLKLESKGWAILGAELWGIRKQNEDHVPLPPFGFRICRQIRVSKWCSRKVFKMKS